MKIKTIIAFAALSLGVFLAGRAALSQQSAKEVVVQTVSTSGGDLTIRRSGKKGDPEDQVFSVYLGAKRISTIKEMMYVTVYSYNAQYAFGDTVVLSTAPGGNACPALFRVVHIKEGGAAIITGEFGDCSDIPTVTADGKGLRMTFPGFYPNYRAQEPGFKPPPLVTYVYKGGTKAVEQPRPPKRN